MSPSLEPPDGMRSQPHQEDASGGGQAPGQPSQGNPENARMVELAHTIVASARQLAKKLPGAAKAARIINEQVREIEKEILKSGKVGESQAPPM